MIACYVRKYIVVLGFGRQQIAEKDSEDCGLLCLIVYTCWFNETETLKNKKSL